MTSTRVLRHRPSIRSFETAAFFAQAGDGTRLYVEERRDDEGAPPQSARSSSPDGSDPGVAPAGIVLCDGILCDGYVYKWFWDEPPIRRPLAHWHYRGHGRSEAPKDPLAITVPDHAQDLRAVCSALGYAKRVLIGHSFGVSCVLESLLQDPTGVLGVVLVSGSARPLSEVFRGQSNLFGFLEKLDALTQQSPRLVRGLWSRIPSGVVARLALSTKEVNSSALNPDDIRPYFEHLSRLDPQFTLRMLQAVGHYDLTSQLSQLSIPALVIAGSADTFIPAAETEALAAALPDARYVCFEGGTHVCPLEFRDAFAHHVRVFLEQIGFYTAAAAEC
jgi:pimeloyl-ACP methyl ester carboxylesterase